MSTSQSTSQCIVNTSSPETDEQVIEKLFPKCRPKQNHQPGSAGKIHQTQNITIHNNRVSPESRSDHRSTNFDRSNSNNDRMNDCGFHTNNCCERHYPSPSRSNHGDSGLNLHLLSFSPVKSNSSLKTKDHGSKHSNCTSTKPNNQYELHRAHAAFTRMTDQSSLADHNKVSSKEPAIESYLISPTEKLSEASQLNPGHRHHQERSCSEPTLEAPVIVPVSQGLYTQMHSTEPMAQSVTANASPEDATCVPMSARSLPCSPKAVKEEDASALNNCVSHCLNHEVSESGHSTAQSSPAKEIARIIGNIPIALYEGSPRRYGLKNQPGYSQRILSSSSSSSTKNNNNTSLSLHGDDMYNVSSNSEMKDDLEELQDLDTALVDVNCDELVKSILSIPLPSSTLNNADTLNEDSPVISPVKELDGKANTSDSLDKQATTEQHQHQHEQQPQNQQQHQPQQQQLLQQQQQQVNTFNSQGAEDASERGVKRSQSSDDPVISHESELILLHERVHQHLLQELSTPSAVMPSQLTTGSTTTRHVCSSSGSSEQQQQQQQGGTSCFKPISQHESTSREEGLPPESSGKIEESRNFTLSPETTECDSNEIESEYSLSSGSKLTHMPILEDGLSSGIPSSDSEYEDIECNNSRSSVVG